MDVLADIKKRLLDGKQPADLVREGYAKSSVYHVAKKVRDAQLGTPSLPVSDELTELRRKRDIIKLEKEIAELEAAKEKLPERLASIEAKLEGLRLALPKLVGHCYASLFTVTLASRGQDWDKAAEEARKVADQFISVYWTEGD